MKTVDINYAYGKSITVEVPRKKKYNDSLVDCLISGAYRNFNDLKVVCGFDDFLKFVIKNHNNRYVGKEWFVQCNGFCLGAVITKSNRDSKTININTYREFRKSKI